MWKDSSILCFTECEGKISKAKGIWVNAEGDGIRAIERVVREGFVAVASDIEMPGIKGCELL
jgi:CheY-like chemotaxis protein